MDRNRLDHTAGTMRNRFHRHCKALASLILGVWLFGLFVGIAHACGVGTAPMAPPDPALAAALGESCAGDASRVCEKFCNDDIPVIAKLQSVADPPAGHPLVLASLHGRTFASIPESALHPALAAHPRPGVPLSLRVVRLTL
jgi:hypothetical protein